jgi:hypothetical protein
MVGAYPPILGSTWVGSNWAIFFNFLVTLLTSIRLYWKGLPATNTLTYAKDWCMHP